MVTNNYLFVYGTLLNTENEFGEYLQKNCSFYANGRFKGLLYDVGEYPGAILNNDDTYVYGRIFLIEHTDAVLERLDDYEGYGQLQAQPNLFIRKIIEAETDNGNINCWCYLYNLPVDELRLITSGDYTAYTSGQ